MILFPHSVISMAGTYDNIETTQPDRAYNFLIPKGENEKRNTTRLQTIEGLERILCLEGVR